MIRSDKPRHATYFCPPKPYLTLEEATNWIAGDAPIDKKDTEESVKDRCRKRIRSSLKKDDLHVINGVYSATELMRWARQTFPGHFLGLYLDIHDEINERSTAQDAVFDRNIPDDKEALKAALRNAVPLHIAT